MSEPQYSQKTVIVKRQPQEGKIKRWVVKPITRVVMGDKKKDRVSA